MEYLLAPECSGMLNICPLSAPKKDTNLLIIFITQAAMVKTVKRSRPDICGWWFAWGGLLVSSTTAVGLFAEYFQRLYIEKSITDS